MEIHKDRVYRHFKGDHYIVIDTAINNDTEETFVIYRALYDNGELFVRSEKDFVAPVDKVKYPDISQTHKFELVEIDSINPTHKK